MPKMGGPGKQVKAWLPQPMYDAVQQDSKDTGRPMAEIVRGALAWYYQAKAQAAGLSVEVQVEAPPHPVG